MVAGNSLRPTVLGIDVGGTKTAIIEATADGVILSREQIPTQGQLPFAEGFRKIEAQIESVLSTSTAAGRAVRALSLAVPGPVHIETGVFINPPNLPGWHGARIKQRLCDKFGLPVFLEHDGNAGALAEFYFGAGRGRKDLKHLVFLTFGTGMGAGIIVNGAILHGACETAGEVGHIRVAPDGPVSYGKAGSWEGLASGAGLVKLAHRMYPVDFPAEQPVRNVIEAMLRDEPKALVVAAECGKWLGCGIAMLVDTLNPQMVVLGSLAIALGERVLAPARAALAAEALPEAVAACELVPSVLGPAIGDYASIMAALTRAPELFGS